MIKERIKKLVTESLEDLQKQGKLEQFELPEIELEHPENVDHGDYSTNIAFLLGRQLKKNPVEIAEFLVEHTRYSIQSSGDVHKIEIAGSGFINFYLSKQFLLDELLSVLREGDAYGSQEKNKKKMVLDYSGPNIAKPFGVGHLRSTVIGQAIYNLYSFLGWKVIGDNHLGDWGTPHGKILRQLKVKMLEGKSTKEAKQILENLTIQDLEDLYVSFGKEAEENPALLEEARSWFHRLEQGDKEAKMLWEYERNISLREFNRIYQALGVNIDYTFGESFYEPMLKDVINEMKKKGVATESQGALIVAFPEDMLPPAILLKSDGATNYFTRDIATIMYRLDKWDPDLIVYETGVEQSLNFQQLFWTAELMGLAKRDRFHHVVHGLYRTKEGKLSTRKGHTIHLEEILMDAIIRAKAIIEESSTASSFSDAEKDEIARIVGIGAVKYNDLSQHPRKDIVFDWDKILNLKGNSAPYLQYTYARCQSILGKAESHWPSKTIEYRDLSVAELDIARQVYRFGEIVQEAAEKFSPNILCTYLFNLAQTYNAFYTVHPVLQAETKDQREFRLVLTAATAQIMKTGLTLVGIQTLERM